MTEYLVNKAFEGSGKIFVIEVPPGVGKTYYGIRKALELASKGRVVIYALPNHQSLITAFAYAITHYTRLMRTIPKKRYPYVVYYEGVQRFCPLLKDPDTFRRAIDWMAKKGLIDTTIHDAVSKLHPREVFRIYGSINVCRLLCPIYTRRLDFKEKIFVTRTAESLTSTLEKYTSKTENTRVFKAIGTLNKLRTQGLVAVLTPAINSNGSPEGYCVRAILRKPLNKRKTLLVLRGGLILTPMQALGFILSQIIPRIKTLRNRGSPVPLPLVILDEYDAYIYKPMSYMLFSVHQLKKEMDVAVQIMRREAEKKRRGDPDYNWEKLVAGLVAYKVLSMLEEDYDKFMKLVGKSEDTIKLATSPANVLAECASTPLESDISIIPPFAPRKLDFSKYDKILAQIYEFLKDVVEEYEEEEGIVFYLMDDVKAKGLEYFLSLWESILVAEARAHTPGWKYMIPALYRSFHGVYEVGYVHVDNTYASIASQFTRFVLGLPSKTVYIHYKVVPTRRKIYDANGSQVAEGGAYLVMGIYDPQIIKLLEADADVVLMSATGIPWFTDFYSTRSGGEGAKLYEKKYQGSEKIMDTLSELDGFILKNLKHLSYFVIKPKKLSKEIVVLMLDDESRLGYSSHGMIVPMAGLERIPHGGGVEYVHSLLRVLNAYVSVLTQFLPQLLMARKFLEGKIPAILVLCQRKDIAGLLVYELASSLSSYYQRDGRVSTLVCQGINCVPLERTDAITTYTGKENISHFVIEYTVRRSKARYYVTWVRSRMTRGIDLPEDTIALAVLLVGSPYRPPQAFDILPASIGGEAESRATRIAIKIFIKDYDPKNMVLLVHNPIDVAESVGEFVQAVGRALRRAWKISAEKGRKAYTVGILIPSFTWYKIYNYSPVWFRDIFYH